MLLTPSTAPSAGPGRCARGWHPDAATAICPFAAFRVRKDRHETSQSAAKRGATRGSDHPQAGEQSECRTSDPAPQSER